MSYWWDDRADYPRWWFLAVAVVATETVGHGEELYVDYFQDQRIA